MKHRLFFLILSLVVAALVAAAPDCPIRTVDGKNYYEYTVKAGDGLFSIARSFGVKQSVLSEANPGLTSDIRPGQVILIPAPDTVQLADEPAVAHAAPDAVASSSTPLVHVVEPHQTLYGISRIYKTTVDSIIALNPRAKDGLHPGDSLVIRRVVTAVKVPASQTAAPAVEPSQPDAATTPAVAVPRSENAAPAHPAFHVVKRRETLYAISRLYDIPIHDLIALNPSAENGLRVGDTLRLDTPQLHLPAAIPSVPHGPSTASVQPATSAVTDADTVSMSAVTPSFVDSDFTTPSFQRPHLDPMPVESRGDTAATGFDASAVNIVYLLPFQTDQSTVHKSTMRFVEFYRGSLVALEKAKQEGVSAVVRTYDTGRTRADIEEILKLPALAEADIIIGPAYSDQLEAVVAFAHKHNIATVIPFSSKVPEHLYYPGLVQFNPSVEHVVSQSVAAVAADRNRRYVIGRFANVDPDDNALADELKRTLAADGVSVIDTMLDFGSLRYIVDQVGSLPTTLLMASSSPVDVNVMLDSLSAYQHHNIQVWGSEKWATLVNKYPNTIYTSLFNLNESPAYISQYNGLFGPHVSLTDPRYDLIGYDLTTLATCALRSISDTTYQVAPLPADRYMQSPALYLYIQNRLLNNRLYIYHWDGVTLNEREYIDLPKSFADEVSSEE